MAIRGNLAKTEIIKKILETFPGSFLSEKEIRIPWVEEGEQVQIKLNLVCAKDNIPHAGNDSTPAASVTSSELTPEEKKETLDLIGRLGL